MQDFVVVYRMGAELHSSGYFYGRRIDAECAANNLKTYGYVAEVVEVAK